MLRKVTAFTWIEKIAYLFLLSEGFLIVTLFFVWWFNPSHIPNNFDGVRHIFDFILFILVSYVVWYEIINQIFSWYIAGFASNPVPLKPEDNLKVAFLTAFVPGKEPYDVLENTLKSMVNCDYKHETWLLDEGNDEIASQICAKYGIKHYSRKGIEKYNLEVGPFKAKTKGGNYNSWFDQFGNNYDVVAQLDVDFVPKKDFLLKTLGYFRDPEVAFVGTPQIYGNTDENWIAKGAAQQAYGFYGSMQKGLFGENMTLFIGANHLIRVKAHNSIDGYSGHIVEDHLTGMKFYSKKWKSVYVPKVLAVGEGPSTWDSYFSQQMRWAYGLIDILFNHSPKIFKELKLNHKIYYFLLQQYYFYGLAQVIGLFLILIFFMFGIETTSMPLIELLILYIPLVIFEQIFFLWLQRFNIDPKKERGMMWEAKLLNLAAWPIYFLALVGVIFNKKLTYKVTPKGDAQDNNVNLSHFIPHFAFGSVSLMSLIISITTHNTSAFLVFWAIINTITMYGFILVELIKKLTPAQKSALQIAISAPLTLFIGFELSYNILNLIIR